MTKQTIKLLLLQLQIGVYYLDLKLYNEGLFARIFLNSVEDSRTLDHCKNQNNPRINFFQEIYSPNEKAKEEVVNEILEKRKQSKEKRRLRETKTRKVNENQKIIRKSKKIFKRSG